VPFSWKLQEFQESSWVCENDIICHIVTATSSEWQVIEILGKTHISPKKSLSKKSVKLSILFVMSFVILHFILGSHLILYVVTQFWTPRAGDGVYLFWTECRSLAHICQKIDKSTERNILFFETLFELFSALFILPLYYQNHQVLLGWSGVFIMLNSFFFIWSLRLNKSLRICTKK